MGINKFCSYNCKSGTRSVDNVRMLCRTTDFVCMQKKWLRPDDIPYLGSIVPDFAFTEKSVIDKSKGVSRGRPYGGVVILWRKSVFNNVTAILCNSDRLTALKVQIIDCSFLLPSAYIPTDDINSLENLAEFPECLGEIRVIVNESVDSVFILEDFSASVQKRFSKELQYFYTKQKFT